MFLETTNESGWIHMQIWAFVLFVIGLILIAAVVTFFLTRKLFQRELQKNPPINEAMIRAMFQQMGRTPSEKQVRAVMHSMNEANEKEEAKKKALKEAAEKKAARKKAREEAKQATK